MHSGGNRIYGHHMIIHNGQFAECEVFENFQGLCGPRTRTRTCKLILEDPRGQGLSSRTTTLGKSGFEPGVEKRKSTVKAVMMKQMNYGSLHADVSASLFYTGFHCSCSANS